MKVYMVDPVWGVVDRQTGEIHSMWVYRNGARREANEKRLMWGLNVKVERFGWMPRLIGKGGA